MIVDACSQTKGAQDLKRIAANCIDTSIVKVIHRTSGDEKAVIEIRDRNTW